MSHVLGLIISSDIELRGLDDLCASPKKDIHLCNVSYYS